MTMLDETWPTPAEIAYAIADQLELHPERYDQSTYFDSALGDFRREDLLTNPEACGTVACIAGHIHWELWRQNKVPYYSDSHVVASQALGLDPEEAEAIFDAHPERWPIEYRDEIRHTSKGSIERAKIAARMLRDGVQDDGTWRVPGSGIGPEESEPCPCGCEDRDDTLLMD